MNCTVNIVNVNFSKAVMFALYVSIGNKFNWSQPTNSLSKAVNKSWVIIDVFFPNRCLCLFIHNSQRFSMAYNMWDFFIWFLFFSNSPLFYDSNNLLQICFSLTLFFCQHKIPNFLAWFSLLFGEPRVLKYET